MKRVLKLLSPLVPGVNIRWRAVEVVILARPSDNFRAPSLTMPAACWSA